LQHSRFLLFDIHADFPATKQKSVMHIIRIARNLFLFVFCLGVNTIAPAQSIVRFGVNAGLNYSGFTGLNKPQNVEKGYGLKGGLFLDARTGKYGSLRVELNYSRRKAHFEESIQGINQSLLKLTETNDYTELPIFLRLRNGDETFKTFINIGGLVAVDVKKQRKGTVTIDQHNFDSENFYNDEVNFFDYGLSAGCGFQIDAFSVEARYYLSLNNLYTGENYREMRYYTYSLSVGYEINHPTVFKSSFRKISLKQKIKHRWNQLF